MVVEWDKFDVHDRNCMNCYWINQSRNKLQIKEIVIVKKIKLRKLINEKYLHVFATNFSSGTIIFFVIEPS